MIDRLLQKIGLTEKETKVYEASLHLGLQPASVIAKRAGINRVTCYQVLRKLVEKGLAYSFIRNAITYFSVENPEGLKHYIQRKQRSLEDAKERLEDTMASLVKNSYDAASQPSVRYYDTLDGLKTMYEDMIRFDETMYVLSPTESAPEELCTFLRQRFYPKLLRNKGSFEMLTSARKDLMMSLGAYDFPTSRIIHVERLEQDVEIILYGTSKVAFITYHQDAHGVLLDNAFIYRALKFHFQVLRMFYQGQLRADKALKMV